MRYDTERFEVEMLAIVEGEPDERRRSRALSMLWKKALAEARNERERDQIHECYIDAIREIVEGG